MNEVNEPPQITLEELARVDKRKFIYPVFQDGRRGPPCEYDSETGCLRPKYLGGMLGLTERVEIDGVVYRVKKDGK